MKKPPTNYGDLLGIAEKYINVEEAQSARKNEPDLVGTRTSWSEKRIPHLTFQNGILRSFLNYAPGNQVAKRVMQVLVEKRPRGYLRRPPTRVSRLFCAFHQIYGHST